MTEAANPGASVSSTSSRCPTAALSTGPVAVTVVPVAGSHRSPHAMAAASARATAICSASG